MKSLSAFTDKYQSVVMSFVCLIVGALALNGCGQSDDHHHSQNARITVQRSTLESEFFTTYANIAHASFLDAWHQAEALQTAIDTFISSPTQPSLDIAKAAYTQARKPYAQTEVFRFDEGFVTESASRIGSVDAWEGQINAWPLDEALLDYVDVGTYVGEYIASANVMNSDSILVAGHSVQTSPLTPEVLISLNEVGGSEAHVATGYHAVEFLLWGQDVHGTNPGAGQRPISDFQLGSLCTSGVGKLEANDAVCQKRREYLTVAVALLVSDLKKMVAEWDPATQGNTLRRDFLSKDRDAALRHALFGMGSLSLGELASERMQIALITGSTEDENDCFSDTTHNTYYYNAKGIRNLYEGQYRSTEGVMTTGTGLSAVLQQVDSESVESVENVEAGQEDVNPQLAARFAAVEAAMQAIVDSAEIEGVKFDQLIATTAQGGTEARRALVSNGIDALAQLTDTIEAAAARMGINHLDSDRGSQF